MEFYVPDKPQDEFRPALVSFLLVMLLSVAAGLILGYGVRLLLGGDQEIAYTYTYTERMTAAKTAFSADLYAYQVVAAQLSQDPGTGIYRAADGEPVVITADGSQYSPQEYYTEIHPVQTETGETMAVTTDDDGEEAYTEMSGETVSITAQDVIDDVYQVFAGAEAALAEYTDSAGDPVTDVTLYHIASGGGNVYFYLYYDEAGFISIAYNPADDFSQRMDPIALMTQWYLDYAYETD